MFRYVLFSLLFTGLVAACNLLKAPDDLFRLEFPFDAGIDASLPDGGRVDADDISNRRIDPSFYEEEYQVVEAVLNRPIERTIHYEVTYREMRSAKNAHTWGNPDWDVVVIPEVPPLGRCSCIDPEFRYYHPAPYNCWTWAGAAIREILQQERLEGNELQQATEEAAKLHECGAYNSRS